ncbi:DHH family phosphoesterase [Sulfoacidibacillus thermotolerans]|uniref:Uncharacterized protein n=1 Tax=Sulfoacidibacillus thermotolerans TaxID=1765684 RepID=A0A2U3DA24_SULT2|nr:DHH family phosphoesterase [Sulfoacidibacillus thermotolerans]PWI58121.1 hypothetical protein BM613_05535 [Sulfoacidibacillus thermotolerans]
MDHSPLLAPLLDAKNIHLFTHVRGDPDSASCFALALALQKLGKTVSVSHDLPAHLHWLHDGFSFPSQSDEGALRVAIDTGNYARLAFTPAVRAKIAELIAHFGTEQQVPSQRLWSIEPIDVVIDHHASNKGYGRLNWIVPTASSSAELLTELIAALEATSGTILFSEEVCRLLYTGIVSDTQWFKRDVTPRTYTMASLLETRAKIDKVEIAERLAERSIAYFQIGATLRANFKQYDDLLVSFLDRQALEQVGLTAEEAAQTMEELEHLPGKIFILFVELATGEIRVRIRGKGVVILSLAQQFGGGGHEFRAGATLSSWREMQTVITYAQKLLAIQAKESEFSL